MTVIDLRSDTLTLPSIEMSRAMAAASLGDDGFHEDPTVNALEEKAADRLGKEAALFVSSGTMGNLLGLLVNAAIGEEVIADADAHVFISEAGGAAAIGGIQIRQIHTEAGVMSPEQVNAAVRDPAEHTQPRTAMLAIENTHNRHDGIAWPLGALRAVEQTARTRGLRIHMDGARIFNAAIATSVEARDIAACADTVMFCLSKGLGCPVGSVLVGTRADIGAARRWRKRLGGGMRQAGIIAAAGIYALDHMVDRLAEDHANARLLADGLAQVPGLSMRPDLVQTNLVFVQPLWHDPAAFVEECRLRGLRILRLGEERVRFVTYAGVTTSDVKQAVRVVSEVLQGTAPAHRAAATASEVKAAT